ncbi:SWI/SNF complex subunit SWI3C-like isoform X2 [Impatiens glandulifera]|uniref:SWI/SNF complex subunit SWI3C-like isoform X2 n=1 Tax=Impatiens glandulifera TaxID=253017 RepID=UPI001FB060DD|nr:SWI/SNF complex subunit SWI3C-like isoform X2 [Impatiens glandulifera]
MPASSSEPRTRWRRKRKRQPPIGQRPKSQQQDDDDEEEDDEEDDDLQQHEFEQGQRQNHEISKSRLDPYNPGRDNEVHVRAAEKISDFPPAVKQKLNRPHSSVSSIVALEKAIHNGESKTLFNGVVFENISHGQFQALSAVPRDSPSLLPPSGDHERLDGASSSTTSSSAPSYVITPPPVMEGRGVIKRFGGNRILVVPMHADWFTPNSVHRLERQVLPHFFTGKSNEHNPEKYMGCRNLIISKYMENPEKRITVSDCEGFGGVSIEIEDLTRIVRFLDNWGIINYCSSSSSSSSSPLNPDSCLKEDANGEVQVPSAALKSIDSLIMFDKPKCRLKAADVYPLLSSSIAEEEDCDLDWRIRERLSENKCSYCSCTPHTAFYQSQKEVDVLVCFDCYNDGRFIVGHSSLDFVKIDSSKGFHDLDSESWTDQETLLLLEAIEVYNDNWNEIADHVGTKSKAQCILQFVRLPMEDGQLENIQVPNNSQVSNGDDPRRPDLYPNEHSAGPYVPESDPDSSLPFANSKNPVMSLVAFLTSAVGPRVAAACAHTSLAMLTSDGLASSENIEQAQSSGLANRMNLESFCNNDGNLHGENANSSQRNGDSGLHGCSSRGKQLRNAAQAGLSAAATKAKLFADHEEREIQRLSANIINNQLKRLELKLKQFAEIETLLMKECEQVERTRQRLAGDRARVLSGQFGPTSGMTPSGPINMQQAGAAAAAASNIRQQPTQTPFVVPGYGTSQAIHPQFMPRQPMYGLGPRLPLSAIHPSSTASGSMFNTSANAQSSGNHPNSGLGS